MSIEKGLKLKDTTAGNILTVDEQGKPTSANINISEIATKAITSDLDSRITSLEGSVEQAVAQAKSING